MSELVDECRREWKRLGVPEAVAMEMAAELEADLGEALAEGVPAEDVLGRGAFHPRSFAESWAVERGVVPLRPAFRRGRRRVLAAFVTLTALVMLGASFAILTSDSAGTAGTLLAAPDGSPHLVRVIPSADGGSPVVLVDPAPARAPVWVVSAASGDVVRLGSTDDDLDAVAWVLLAVGLAGLVPAGVLWFSRSRGHGPVAA